MLRLVVLLALCLPLAELAVWVAVAHRIGWLNAVALTLATAVLGAALAKRIGFAALQKWQRARAEGQVPDEGLMGALLAFVASGLLLLPGFITDALALVLLFPPTRRMISSAIGDALMRGIRKGSVRVVSSDGAPIITQAPVDITHRLDR